MKLLLILLASLSLGENSPDRLYREVPIHFQGVIPIDSLVTIVDEWKLESVALVDEDSVFVVGEYTVLEPYPPTIEIEVVESPDTHEVMHEPEITLGETMFFPDTCSRRGSSDLGDVDKPDDRLTKQELENISAFLEMVTYEPLDLPSWVYKVEDEPPIMSKWDWIILGALAGSIIVLVIRAMTVE